MIGGTRLGAVLTGVGAPFTTPQTHNFCFYSSSGAYGTIRNAGGWVAVLRQRLLIVDGRLHVTKTVKCIRRLTAVMHQLASCTCRAFRHSYQSGTFPQRRCFPAQTAGPVRAAKRSRRWRRTMKRSNRHFIALALGLSGTAFASQVSAQDSAARDAAIAKCVKQPQTAYPLDGDDQGRNRTALYKACMTAAGFNP
jgi:hypothetical protein